MSEGDQPANRREQEAGRPQIGAVLEKRRREKGLSLKEVQQATKIRTRYLEGLEREDYNLLPDAVYARGFLRPTRTSSASMVSSSPINSGRAGRRAGSATSRPYTATKPATKNREEREDSSNLYWPPVALTPDAGEA